MLFLTCVFVCNLFGPLGSAFLCVLSKKNISQFRTTLIIGFTRHCYFFEDGRYVLTELLFDGWNSLRSGVSEGVSIWGWAHVHATEAGEVPARHGTSAPSSCTCQFRIMHRAHRAFTRHSRLNIRITCITVTYIEYRVKMQLFFKLLNVEIKNLLKFSYISNFEFVKICSKFQNYLNNN